MTPDIPAWDGRRPGDPASEDTRISWAVTVRLIRQRNGDTDQVCRQRRRQLMAG